MPGTVEGVLQWWSGVKFKKLEWQTWKALPFELMWSVWKLRNDCVFNGGQPKLDELGEIVKVRVALWFKFNSKGVPYSVHDIVSNHRQVRYC